MGWPIPSCISLLTEEQPKAKTNDSKITNLANIDFIQITLFFSFVLSFTLWIGQSIPEAPVGHVL
jgi:hypothetical protein